MRLILRVHRAGSTDGLRSGPSVSALGVSGLLHAACIAAIFLTASSTVADKPQTLYAQLIAPEEKKIVWYPLRELPSITPAQRIGDAAVPQGREKRDKLLISDDPKADPGKQLLWRPDSDKKIVQEIPAPNLVAVEAPRAVPPRAVFRPPVPTPAPAEKSLDLPQAPMVPAGGSPAPALPGALASTPKPNRPFAVLPAQPVRRDNPALTIEAPAAVGEVRAGTSALDSVIGSASVKPARRVFVAPSGAGAGGRGAPVNLSEPDGGAPASGGVNAAVLNAAAIDKVLATIPEGSRSVQMSGGPTQGPSSSGAGKGGGLQIPGVAAEGRVASAGVSSGAGGSGPKLPGGASIPRKTVYEETRVSVRRAGLSNPLRPSARVIPQFIEARFHERVVYTMIVVKPQVPMYSGDWVLWFAEKQAKPGNSPQMRAPQPIRKMEVVEEAGGEAGGQAGGQAGGPGGPRYWRVQFAATILKNGQLEAIAVLSGATSVTAQAAVRDLESWQFVPALRDGEAVDVEVILEIPFQNAMPAISTGISRY